MHNNYNFGTGSRGLNTSNPAMMPKSLNREPLIGNTIENESTDGPKKRTPQVPSYESENVSRSGVELRYTSSRCPFFL